MKNISFFALLLSLCVIVIACSGNSKNTNKDVMPEDLSRLLNKGSDIPWEGTYTAFTIVNDGCGYEHYLSIKKSDNGFTGFYCVGGEDINITKIIKCKLSADDSSELEIYIAEGSNYGDGVLKDGFHLCSLFYDERSMSFSSKWSDDLGEMIEGELKFEKLSSKACKNSEEIAKLIYGDNIEDNPEDKATENSNGVDGNSYNTPQQQIVVLPPSNPSAPITDYHEQTVPQPRTRSCPKPECRGGMYSCNLYHVNYTSESRPHTCTNCGDVHTTMSSHTCRCNYCGGDGIIGN